VGEARLHPAAVVGVGDVLADRRLELRRRRACVLALHDPGAPAHHLRQRPV